MLDDEYCRRKFTRCFLSPLINTAFPKLRHACQVSVSWRTMSNTYLISQVLDMIVSETGMSHDELDNESEFSDLCIDPILSKSIVDRVSVTTRVILDPKVFHTCSTVGSLHYLATLVSLSSPSPDVSSSSNGLNAIRLALRAAADVQVQQQPSLVIRQQGNPRDAQRNVLLLPDGSGTGIAYARVPALGPGVCLYGLNSPFLKNTGAGSFGRKLEDVAHISIPDIHMV